MGRKHLAYALAAVTTVVVVAVGAYVVLDAGDDSESRKVAASTPTPSPSPSAAGPVKPIGEPVQLIIDKIDVDAEVRPVGTTPEGAQEVPKSLAQTGWWRDGQKPGQPGNAVIVGHTASADDGVFDELAELEQGDRLTVQGERGTMEYTVTAEKEIPVADFAPESDRIYRTTGASGLVLMTCGDWNGTEFETTVITYATATGVTGPGRERSPGAVPDWIPRKKSA